MSLPLPYIVREIASSFRAQITESNNSLCHNPALTSGRRSQSPRRRRQQRLRRLSDSRFEKFAHDYGVNFVILEQTNRTVPWDELLASPTRSMHWQADIPLRCSFPDRSGTPHIYRFTNPSPNPKQTLHMEKGVYRRDMDLTGR